MYSMICSKKEEEEGDQENQEKKLKWIAAKGKHKSLIGYYSRDVSYYAIQCNIKFYVLTINGESITYAAHQRNIFHCIIFSNLEKLTISEHRLLP